MQPLKCGHFHRLQGDEAEVDVLVPMESFLNFRPSTRWAIKHESDQCTIEIKEILDNEERKPSWSFETFMLVRALVRVVV